MTIGRTISIYLPDANPQGIKICEILDSLVKAVLIPRAKLSDAVHNSELAQPGVYFLIGEKDEVGNPSIYIGEAEVLLTRIKTHNIKRDSWNQVVCFVSEKKNLNKAHIKYLENHAWNEAKMAKKCIVENKTEPTQSSLTNSQRDFVLGFFEDLKIIMTTLGYPIFEQTKTKKSKKNMYYCRSKDADALGEYTEEGFIVTKGSKSNLKETLSIMQSIKTFRANLIEKEILKEENGVYVFQEDFTFSSPSTAASVVLARTANGWKEWKIQDGGDIKTLDDVIRKKQDNGEDSLLTGQNGE
jgi:hypothetical protein